MIEAHILMMKSSWGWQHLSLLFFLNSYSKSFSFSFYFCALSVLTLLHHTIYRKREKDNWILSQKKKAFPFSTSPKAIIISRKPVWHHGMVYAPRLPHHTWHSIHAYTHSHTHIHQTYSRKNLTWHDCDCKLPFPPLLPSADVPGSRTRLPKVKKNASNMTLTQTEQKYELPVPGWCNLCQWQAVFPSIGRPCPCRSYHLSGSEWLA